MKRALLSDNFYVFPRYANTVMSTKEFRQILKDYDGYILTCGHIWDIIGMSLGAGMYRVTLSLRES